MNHPANDPNDGTRVVRADELREFLGPPRLSVHVGGGETTARRAPSLSVVTEGSPATAATDPTFPMPTWSGDAAWTDHPALTADERSAINLNSRSQNSRLRVAKCVLATLGVIAAMVAAIATVRYGERQSKAAERSARADENAALAGRRSADAAEEANRLAERALRAVPDPIRRERWWVEDRLRDNIIHALERCGTGWTLAEVEAIAVNIVAENHHIWPDFSHGYLIVEFPDGNRWVQAPVVSCEAR